VNLKIIPKPVHCRHPGDGMSLFDTFGDFLRLFETGFWERARGRKPKVYFFFTDLWIFPGAAIESR
jgi:hypothetical protein